MKKLLLYVHANNTLVFKENVVNRKPVAFLAVKIHRKRKGILIQCVYFKHPHEMKEISEGFFSGQKFK